MDLARTVDRNAVPPYVRTYIRAYYIRDRMSLPRLRVDNAHAVFSARNISERVRAGERGNACDIYNI